ncbi:MAG: cob(I)yrinic acid a,c-diamide adenosyltransferase [Candidatus Poribacteria bacterium]|nr:cob(I)yrinic acid a,c-diamide adenosyltransferase [Candidatus Poribacteria bacterium]
MKIYTKTGDTGETGLFGGARIPKNSLRIDAIGTIDELNACIGTVRSQIADEAIDNLLHRIQNELFNIGADLATLDSHAKSNQLRISEDFVGALENDIDRLENELAPLRNFILPGGSVAGSTLHLARTVCRRSERTVVMLADSESINPAILPYLNRLSDFLFVLARFVNSRLGQPEPLWESPLAPDPAE